MSNSRHPSSYARGETNRAGDRPPVSTGSVQSSTTYREEGSTHGNGFHDERPAASRSYVSPTLPPIVRPDVHDPERPTFRRDEQGFVPPITRDVLDPERPHYRREDPGFVPAGFVNPGFGDQRRLWYRVYDEGGALRSANQPGTEDPCLSFVLMRSIAPPHTVASVKNRIADAESISGDCRLYATNTSNSPMEDREMVPLASSDCPGLNPDAPLAFVAAWPVNIQMHRPTVNMNNTASSLIPEGSYLFYRSYTDRGERNSRQPVDRRDSCIGCIRLDSIPPPKTYFALAKCLSRNERFFHPTRVRLYQDVRSVTPINQTQLLSFTGPSSFTRANPLVFVMANNGGYDMPAIAHSGIRSDYPDFLEAFAGEIFYTDGNMMEVPSGPRRVAVCRAMSSSGRIGYLQMAFVNLLPDLKL